MTTERLYYDDAFVREFTTQVLSCEPARGASLAANDALQTPAGPPAGELWRVKLDRTAFYPTSGGQPHDTGRLGDARVVDVLDENEEVIHVVDKPIDFVAVKGMIDWDRRFGP